MLALLLATLAWAEPVEDTLSAIAPLRAQRLAEAAPHIPPDAYRKAATGKLVSGVEMVEGVAAGKGWGIAIYDLPIDIVWKAVNDEPGQAELLPISVSDVVGGQPRATGRLLFQYMPLPIVADRWWVVQVEHNSDLFAASDGRLWEQAWTDATDPAHLEGTPYAKYQGVGQPVDWTKGSWFLIALDDGRTLVEYFSWSDPGGRVPAGPASRFAGGAIKDTLEALRELAEHHRSTPSDGFVKPDQSPL